MGGGTALFGHLSHAGTRIPFFRDVVEPVDSFEMLLASHYVLPMDGLQPDRYDQTVGQNIDPLVDVMHGATDKRYHNDSYSFNVVSPSMAYSDDVVKALAGLNLFSAPSGVGGVIIVHYQNADSENPASNCREPSQDFSYSASPSLLVNHINMEKPRAIDPRALGGGFSLGPVLTEGTNSQNVKRTTFHMTSAALQMPLVDPLYLQCQDPMTIEPDAQTAASLIFPQWSSSFADLLGAQRAYLGYYGLPALGQSLPYAERHLSPIVRSSPVSPIRHGAHCMSVPSILRQLNGGIMTFWHLDTCGVMDERCPSSILEELKVNTRYYQHSEIAGPVVGFRTLMPSFLVSL